MNLIPRNYIVIFKEGDDDDHFHGKIRVKIVDQQFLGMLIETLSK